MTQFNTDISLPNGYIPIDKCVFNAVVCLMSGIGLPLRAGASILSTDDMPCMSVIVENKRVTQLTIGKIFKIKCLLGFTVEVVVVGNRKDDETQVYKSANDLIMDYTNNVEYLILKNNKLGGVVNNISVANILYNDITPNDVNSSEDVLMASITLMAEYVYDNDKPFAVDNTSIVNSLENVYQ